MMISLSKQNGMSSLSIGLILLFATTLITLYASKSTIIEQRVAANNYYDKQAFEAAEAGLERAIAHIETNRATVLVDSNNDGYINSYTQSGTLSNNATYTYSATNITPHDFSLIRVTATGSSPGGEATRTIVQDYANRVATFYTPHAPLVVKGNAALSGNMTISNNSGAANATTIWSGGTASLTGSASTHLSTGTGSDKNTINTDVKQNDASLSGLTGDQFFQNFFSSGKTDIKANADVTYTNSSGHNYSGELNNQVGKIIWIEQTSGTAQINSNTTIGTTAQPVILIVRGDLHINGGLTVNGIVYVVGNLYNSGGGNATINGGLIVEGNFSGTGTPDVNYNETIINNTKETLGEFGKVSGSWRDI